MITTMYSEPNSVGAQNSDMTQIRFFALLLFFISHSVISASSIGIWHSSANPDWKPFDTGTGWAATLDYDVTENLFARVNYYDTSFRASGPEVGRREVNNWSEYGLGYSLGAIFDGLYVYASYTDVSTINGALDGPGIHLGYRYKFAEDWSGFIQVGQIDTGFFDVQLEVQLQYQITEDLNLAVGLRDHHDWDMTNYHVGLSWDF